MKSSTWRISGLSCSISRGERSPSRFTSTLSMTASKIFSRWPVALPDEDGDDHPLAVLRRLVAEADGCALAARPELVGDGRGVEVQRVHRHGRANYRASPDEQRPAPGGRSRVPTDTREPSTASSSGSQRASATSRSIPGGMVADSPAEGSHQEERDDLEDPLAFPGVDVADASERRGDRGVHTRLLVGLAHGGRCGLLTRVDEPFRERPRPGSAPLRADRRHPRDARPSCGRRRHRPRTRAGSPSQLLRNLRQIDSSYPPQARERCYVALGTLGERVPTTRTNPREGGV